jgi:acyl carrier protein
MSDFAAQLIAYITEDLLDPGITIDGSTELLLSGMVDSLGVIQIVDFLESELGSEIDPADVVLENFESVDAMVEFARRIPAI